MSRGSIRMKQYRPMSADFTNSLSSMFGLGQDQGKSGNASGVLLINYKRSSSGCCSPTTSPRSELRRASSGVAPIAKHEDEELDDTDCNHNSSVDRAPSNGEVNTSSSSGRLDMKDSDTDTSDDDDESATVAVEDHDQEGHMDASDDDEVDDEQDSDDVVREGEADFESFSGTDEDEEPASLDSSLRSQDDGQLELKSKFIKTKSLREKFRDSKTWTTLRRSVEKEASPGPNNLIANANHATSTSSINQSNVSSSGVSSDCNSNASEGRLSRLFSLRRSVGPCASPFDSNAKTTMPRLAEEEEQMLGGPGNVPVARKQQPPTLPAMPAGLSPEQLKRRHIVASLVHSENNYVASLQRLVNDYKKPLEDSSPPILSYNKVQLLFHRVPEILQCHCLFRIALSEAIRNWDKDEKIGDVFVASFSKAVVLEIYSDFINNFTTAMECAKSESKRKSALADFLKVKQITAHDRVSFFGLMVKPVQRFPQFILLLQDLLKETPPGHADRMALQLALTTLESLAEMLNERKREAEQYAAFRDKMRNIAGKFPPSKFGQAAQYYSTSSGSQDANIMSSPTSQPSANSISGNSSSPWSANCPQGSRFLLREDDMSQLEFNASGLVCRSKQRRLLLLNDLLVCATVNGRTSEAEFPSGGGGSLSIGSGANERLSLKWAVPVNEVELIDGAAGGTLARMLAAGSSFSSSVSTGKRSSLTRSVTPNHLGLSSLTLSSSIGPASSMAGGDRGEAENLAQDMSNLMHDFDVVSRIASLIGTLKGRYESEGLTTMMTSQILANIQRSIRQKDEEMSWLDSCCLQFCIRTKTKTESYTFQTRDPNVKKEWIVEMRLAQLALDSNNSPGWDVLEQERSVSTKMPLFFKSHLVLQSPRRQTEVTCATSYTLLIQTPTRTYRPQTYVWANATDGISSYLRIFGVTNHHTGLKEMGTVSLEEVGVKAIQYVPGLYGGVPCPDGEPLRSDLVWVGTDTKKLMIYSAMDPDRGTLVGGTDVPGEILCIQYHCDAVWVGLSSGSLAVFRRNIFNLMWDTANAQIVSLGTDPVACLLPVRSAGLYAACGKRVWVIDAFTNELQKNFTVQPRHESNSINGNTSQPHHHHVHQMAQSGVGLWVALKNSATICLYHTETFRHLQDINIASNVSRVLAARYVTQPQRSIYATALMASRGLLWVGTNVGIALTVPLPRLEGVPIISGRANISYHAHYGSVTFFVNVNHKVELPSSMIASPISGSVASLNQMPQLQAQVSAASSSMIREESEKESSDEEDTPPEESDVKQTCKQSSSQGHLTVTPTTSTELTNGEAVESSSNVCHNEDDDDKAGLLSRPPPGNSKQRYRNSSPTLSRRARSGSSTSSVTQAVAANRRASKTLPRGFSLTNAHGAELAGNEYDVYGLYGELLNVRDYDCDSGEIVRHGDVDLRKSDPELSTIPYRVSTLDRRVRMKTSRPRSLDMSSWSVESRGSSGQTTSSSEAGSERPSPNVSRNASFQSNHVPSSLSSSSTTSSSSSSSSSASAMSSGSASIMTMSLPPAVSNAAAPQVMRISPVRPDLPKLDAPKTVTTLMGGRGYINWRRATVEKQRTSALAQINNCDAFIVIWEMKL